MINYIGFLSTSIVYTYIIFDFLEAVYQRNHNRKAIYFIASFVYAVISFVVYIFKMPVVNILCTALLMGIIIYLLYDTKGNNVIFNFIILLSYIVMTDTIISVFFSILASSSTYITTDDTTIYLISGIVNCLVLICTHNLIIQSMQRYPSTKISIILSGYMIFLLIFEIVIISYLLSLNFYTIPIFLISIGFTIIDIGIFHLYRLISKTALLEKQTQFLEQQKTVTLKYCEELQVRYNDTQKLLHDIKRHIQVINKLKIHDDNLKEAYSNNLIKSIDEAEQQFQCSNKIINAVIWDKIQRCHQLNINFNIDMQDIEFDFMSDLEITTLFANLLDNAIEACEISEDTNKEINLRIHKFKDYIVLKLKNNLGKKPVNKSGSLISTKLGHKGIGMLILEDIINKYSGNLNYDCSENYFETNIILLSIK